MVALWVLADDWRRLVFAKMSHLHAPGRISGRFRQDLGAATPATAARVPDDEDARVRRALDTVPAACLWRA